MENKPGVDAEKSLSKEELKRRIKAKRKAARQNAPHDISMRNKLDVTGEMMRMGIDDADVLKLAASIGASGPSGAKRMYDTLKTSLKTALAESDEAPPPDVRESPTMCDTIEDENDEEEAPPPLPEFRRHNTTQEMDDDDEEAPPPWFFLAFT